MWKIQSFAFELFQGFSNHHVSFFIAQFRALCTADATLIVSYDVDDEHTKKNAGAHEMNLFSIWTVEASHALCV